MSTFRPMWDYILVKPIPRSRSDILQVVTSEIDRGSIGGRAEVIAIGTGKLTKKGNIIPLQVKPGNIIWYGGKDLGCINFPKVEDCEVIQEADIMFIEESELCH